MAGLPFATSSSPEVPETPALARPPGIKVVSHFEPTAVNKLRLGKEKLRPCEPPASRVSGGCVAHLSPIPFGEACQPCRLAAYFPVWSPSYRLTDGG